MRLTIFVKGMGSIHCYNTVQDFHKNQRISKEFLKNDRISTKGVQDIHRLIFPSGTKMKAVVYFLNVGLWTKGTYSN